MAGYSGTPLPRKLGIKDRHRIALIHPPPRFRDTLGELPPAVRIVAVDSAGEALDLILLFVRAAADLRVQFAALPHSLAPAGMLWVCWPKKASKMPTDLTENVVREIGLAAGMVDTKVCAIDETWSGLRFVRRLKDRPRA